jgi:hypothetical protein
MNFTVTITHFVPFGSSEDPQFCTGTVDPAGDIEVTASNQVLNFTIAPTDYVPVGAYYHDNTTGTWLTNNNDAEFGEVPTISGQVLTITDAHDNTDEYEMYIEINRVSDGVRGVFDPKIKNQSP